MDKYHENEDRDHNGDNYKDNEGDTKFKEDGDNNGVGARYL